MPDLDRLRETLLRGGIAPKHARRYIAELQDHTEDLMRAGATADQAWVQVGSEDHLAQQMLARTELRSLGARYPVAVFGFGPVLALLLMFVAAVLVLVLAGLMAEKIYGVESSAQYTQEMLDQLRGMAEPKIAAFAWMVKYVAPVVIAWIFAFGAVRQRMQPAWVVAGLAVVAVIGGASDLSITFPTAPGAQGELRLGFGWFPPFPSMDNSLFRAAINFGLVTPALVWLRYLRTSSAR